MSSLSIRSFKDGAKKFGRRLSANTSGTASIELVMLAPMLLIFMIGTMEVSRAINVDKRINSVTSMTGDLISRGSLGATPAEVQTSLNAIMEVIEHVLYPYDSAGLKLSVIPVMADPADETRTFVYAPPFNYNGGVGGVPGANGCFTLGANVLTKGSSAIVVKTEFAYEPIMVDFFDNWGFLPTMTSDDIGWDDSGTTTYTDESIHSPRQGCVDFEANNCVVSTPGGC